MESAHFLQRGVAFFIRSLDFVERLAHDVNPSQKKFEEDHGRNTDGSLQCRFGLFAACGESQRGLFPLLVENVAFFWER